MLILSRRPGESLHLGDDITITVLSVKGQQIKLGLDVPDKMPVYRDEIYKKIQEQNKMAAQILSDDLLAVTTLWKPKQNR
ncbi:MAG: carbon storage regulator [Deltaproteobacteria bacterium]|nr:MAG: carbon storage regulator [Deltaproteobacteria bacterium]